MRLIYASGVFFLQSERPPKNLKHWRERGPNTWVTSSLTEAQKYYNMAEENTRLLLHRFTQTFTPCPAYAPPPNFKFLPWQPRAIEWALTRSKAYLAIGPGGGKTAIAWTVIKADPGKTLIVVPPALIEESGPWGEAEQDKWAPKEFGEGEVYRVPPDSLSVRNHSKIITAIQKAKVVICADSRLRVLQGLDIRWHRIVVDEKHRFNAAGSTRSTILYGHGVSRAKKVEGSKKGLIWQADNILLMSGSPMPNRPIELYLPLSTLVPSAIDFMDKHGFALKFCGAYPDPSGRGFNYDGASNLDELHKRLTKNFMLVISSQEIDANLPKCRDMLYVVTDSEAPEMRGVDEKIRSKYRDPETYMLAATREDPALAEVRLLCGVAMAKPAIDLVLDLIEKNPKDKFILTYAHTIVAGAVEKALKAKGVLSVRVDGATRGKARLEAIGDFQNYPEVKVLLGQIKVLSLGFNLTVANWVINLEPSFTPEETFQAKKRAHRFGQKKPVTCINLAFKGSYHERILKLNLIKRGIILETITPNERGLIC